MENGTNAVSIFVLKKVLERNLLHHTEYYLKQKIVDFLAEHFLKYPISLGDYEY